MIWLVSSLSCTNYILVAACYHNYNLLLTRSSADADKPARHVKRSSQGHQT